MVNKQSLSRVERLTDKELNTINNKYNTNKKITNIVNSKAIIGNKNNVLISKEPIVINKEASQQDNNNKLNVNNNTIRQSNTYPLNTLKNKRRKENY